MSEPNWLTEHRAMREYWLGKVAAGKPIYSRAKPDDARLLADVGFNSHSLNTGRNVSPFDNGRVQVGTDGLEVRLIQGIHEKQLQIVLSRALKATTGVAPGTPIDPADADEMLKGGLQAALETQTIVFEVTGASRALTHQLVRTRKAGFHQQSQRATWYGDRPEFRMPHSVFVENYPETEHVMDGHPPMPVAPSVRERWDTALLACWGAYKAACDAGVSYQDARYILPEGTTNYILCEYTIHEFIAVFAYRGCSMFLWEMVDCMRKMRAALLAEHPFLEPHVKISCEKTGSACPMCHGSGYTHHDGVAATTAEIEQWRGVDGPYHLMQCGACLGKGGMERKCTFQGWENVEGVCDFPWARQDNRVFLPNPKNRIGG